MKNHDFALWAAGRFLPNDALARVCRVDRATAKRCQPDLARRLEGAQTQFTAVVDEEEHRVVEGTRPTGVQLRVLYDTMFSSDRRSLSKEFAEDAKGRAYVCSPRQAGASTWMMQIATRLAGLRPNYRVYVLNNVSEQSWMHKAMVPEAIVRKRKRGVALNERLLQGSRIFFTTRRKFEQFDVKDPPDAVLEDNSPRCEEQLPASGWWQSKSSGVSVCVRFDPNPPILVIGREERAF